MSKLQANGEYEKFKSMNVYPVVSDLETYGWEFGGSAAKVINKAFPICQKDIEELKSGKYGPKYEIIGNPATETVLVRHPFRPYQLIPSDTSEAEIINDHLTDLAMIFTALGAEKCSETAKITKKEEVKIDAKGRMKVKLVKLKGRCRQKTKKTEESEYKLVIEHEPDEKNGYDNAYRMAEKYGLLEVKKIRDIFKLFDPEIHGKNTSYQLSEILTENYHKTLDAVIGINASGIFSFKGSLNVDHKCRRTIRIDKKVILHQNNV